MTSDIFSKAFHDARQPAQTADDRDTTAHTIRSIVQLAIVGLLIGALLQDVRLPVTLLGLCVILLLWLIVRTNATPLLVTLQMVLLFHHSDRTAGESEFRSIMFVAVVLGLLTFLSRDRSLQRLINRNCPDLVKNLVWKPKKSSTPILPESNCPPVVLRNRQSTSPIRPYLLRKWS